MLLKLMSGENAPDSDTRKSFQLIDNVASVIFEREGDKAFVRVYSNDDPHGEDERFIVPGNCYLMNAKGKTVAQFGVGSLPRAA